LELRDGGQIPSQGLRCGYRQNTGADDSLDLQLQYLSAPNAVAFSAYITDPVPAKPFVATPRDVKRFDFEAVAGGNYSAKLQEAEITLRLDDLPAPSSLEDRKVVHLHGTLEITAFSLPARTTAEGSDAGTLDLAPATVAVDCMPGFFLNPVLN
jgi:hypothetical protein